MAATSDNEVWHLFTGGSVSTDGASQSEAEELSTRVAELENEVSVCHIMKLFIFYPMHTSR
jgi:hypothetical protein